MTITFSGILCVLALFLFMIAFFISPTGLVGVDRSDNRRSAPWSRAVAKAAFLIGCVGIVIAFFDSVNIDLFVRKPY